MNNKRFQEEDLSVIEEWTNVVLWITFFIAAAYAFWLYRTDALEVGELIHKTSAGVPLFVLLASVLNQIWRYAMFARAWVERKIRRTIESRLARARAEGVAEGMTRGKAETLAKHNEWVEWANNGMDPDNMPDPPEMSTEDESA